MKAGEEHHRSTGNNMDHLITNYTQAINIIKGLSEAISATPTFQDQEVILSS